MTLVVRLTRQLTSLAASVKQGRPLSPPPVREAGERRLFLHEYPAQECRVELLAAVIASSCGRYAYRPSLAPSHPLCLPFLLLHEGRWEGRDWATLTSSLLLVPCCPEVGNLMQLVVSWGRGDHHVTTQEVESREEKLNFRKLNIWSNFGHIISEAYCCITTSSAQL